MIIYLFSGIILLNTILGFIPIFYRKKNLANFSFLIFSLASSLWALSVILAWSTIEKTMWARLAFFFSSFMPASMLIFVLSYPFTSKWLTKPALYFILTPCLILAPLTLTPYIVESVAIDQQAIYHFGHKIFQLYFIGYYVIMCVIALRRQSLLSGINKQKVIYFNIGLILFLGTFITTNLILPLLGTNQYNKIGPFCTSIFLILSLYSILKFRFMDIKFIISKSVALIVTLTLTMGSYCLIAFIYQQYISTDISMFFILSSSVIWVFISYNFNKLHLHFQSTSNRTLLRGHYDYRKTLDTYVNHLAKKTTLNDCLSLSKDTIMTTLEPNFIEFYLVDSNHSPSKKKKASLIQWKEKNKIWTKSSKIIQSTSMLIQTLESNPHILYIKDTHPLIEECLKELDSEIGIPCITNGHLEGLILLGEKASQRAYSVEDIQLLSTLSAQFSISLDRIKPYQKILADYQHSLEIAENISHQLSYAQLTRGIAHEIRNPLGMILSGMELIMDNIEDTKTTLEYAQLVKKSIIRLSEITNTMLHYGSPVSDTRKSTDINAIILETKIIAKGECLQRHINIVLDNGKIPAIIADANSISQSILNIVLNAIQAIDKNGTIRIKTETASFKDRYFVKQKGIKISIEDTGCGISEDTLFKIFDPFYTTKHNNSGLGLSLVLRIVNEHYGKVDINSKLGEGTQFNLYLPIDSDIK
jgi:signal transduction histidine kinase